MVSFMHECKPSTKHGHFGGDINSPNSRVHPVSYRRYLIFLYFDTVGDCHYDTYFFSK